MWLWILLAAVFLYLLALAVRTSGAETRSRPFGLLAALLDGAAMLAMAVGVFGLLVALAFGVFAHAGPRLVGASLRDMLVWSGGLMVGSILLLVAASGVRSMGGRPQAAELGPARRLGG